MPTTQVELDHRNESLERVFHLGHGEECVGMGHEAARLALSSYGSARQTL